MTPLTLQILLHHYSEKSDWYTAEDVDPEQVRAAYADLISRGVILKNKAPGFRAHYRLTRLGHDLVDSLSATALPEPLPEPDDVWRDLVSLRVQVQLLEREVSVLRGQVQELKKGDG